MFGKKKETKPEVNDEKKDCLDYGNRFYYNTINGVYYWYQYVKEYLESYQSGKRTLDDVPIQICNVYGEWDLSHWIYNRDVDVDIKSGVLVPATKEEAMKFKADNSLNVIEEFEKMKVGDLYHLDYDIHVARIKNLIILEDANNPGTKPTIPSRYIIIYKWIDALGNELEPLNNMSVDAFLQRFKKGSGIYKSEIEI